MPDNQRSANDFLAAASRLKTIGFVSAIKQFDGVRLLPRLRDFGLPACTIQHRELGLA
jgi:hypothetical protein